MPSPQLSLLSPNGSRWGRTPNYHVGYLRKMYHSLHHCEAQVIQTSNELSTMLTMCFPTTAAVQSKEFYLVNLQTPPFLWNLWFSCPFHQLVLLQSFWCCEGGTGSSCSPAPIVSPSGLGHPRFDSWVLRHLLPFPLYWLKDTAYPLFDPCSHLA